MKPQGIFLIRSFRSDRQSLDWDADDCACPADGLEMPEEAGRLGAVKMQSVRLFLQPVDEEHSVGYSPFAQAARSF
jgi:hypothetical protein